MSIWWLTNPNVHLFKLFFSLWVNKVVRHIFVLWCFADWRLNLNVEIFSPSDVKTILNWTFPGDPSTERVSSLAKRIAYWRHLIYIWLFNWKVPALEFTHFPVQNFLASNWQISGMLGGLPGVERFFCGIAMQVGTCWQIKNSAGDLFAAMPIIIAHTLIPL